MTQSIIERTSPRFYHLHQITTVRRLETADFMMRQNCMLQPLHREYGVTDCMWQHYPNIGAWLQKSQSRVNQSDRAIILTGICLSSYKVLAWTFIGLIILLVDSIMRGPSQNIPIFPTYMMKTPSHEDRCKAPASSLHPSMEDRTKCIISASDPAGTIIPVR